MYKRQGAPSTSRFNLSFKNVLTGGIASSNCGGQFGVMLKRAGFDGLIITGRAAEPSLLEILDGEIKLKPAPELWGLDAEKTQEALPEWYGKLDVYKRQGRDALRELVVLYVPASDHSQSSNSRDTGTSSFSEMRNSVSSETPLTSAALFASIWLTKLTLRPIASASCS